MSEEISKDRLRYNGKLYSVAFDNTDKKPCDKCLLRQECVTDEYDEWLTLCEPWMEEGSCYIKEEIIED